MNNPIFIFSLDSIIECWFDYCFLKNYTFHKLTSEFCFFLIFFWESSAGEFWSSNPNKLLHVRRFAASNQCNRPRPELLENTTVKLRSVYVRWLVDFDPRPLSVYLRLRSVYSSRLIKGNEKRNRNVSVKSKLQHAPPGQAPGIWLFWKLLFKFPPTRAKMPFKCPTLGSIQVIKCPHPGDISQAQKWQKDGGNAFSCRTKSL